VQEGSEGVFVGRCRRRIGRCDEGRMGRGEMVGDDENTKRRYVKSEVV
jgi:hypothetical protein